MDLNFLELLSNVYTICLSGLSAWGSLHPVIIHFPIVLLFIAPIFLLAAICNPKFQSILLRITCILMIIGTCFIFLAISTGNTAAERLGEIDLDTVKTLDAHVQLAEKSRLLFSILTGMFLCYLWPLAGWRKNLQPPINRAILITFLIAYLVVLVFLFNAAHYGGRLVHEHHITSNFYTPQ